MPDLEFGRRLTVKENALPAISQIRQQLADAVIAIVDHPPDSCCQVGFHAVPVAKSELPAENFNKIGMIDGMEVTAEAGLLPTEETNVTLGFDRESGTLVAYVS
tara:strand:- start:10443 stop:10754 length:312 start_codon:yes stop_codon:yes gene_type:complete